jgi:hypothetical protein
MRIKQIGFGLLALALLAGSALADNSALTKDEATMTMAVDLQLLRAMHSPAMRKATIAGQKAVVPSLTLRVTDAEGQAIPDANLPPALANLEADLKNTDIDGEIRNAGIQIAEEKSLAPRLLIFVMSVPAIDKPDFKTRKMYSVTGMVAQVMTVGLGLLGRREAITTGTFGGKPIVSTLDDSADASTIRVAVRKIVDEYVAEAKGTAGK